MGTVSRVRSDRLLAPRAVALELGATLGTAFGLRQQGRTAFRAELLLAGRAVIVAYLNQLTACGAGELDVLRRRRTTGGTMILAGVQLAQTLFAEHGLASRAGRERRVQVCAAPGAGGKERQSDPVPGRPVPADQGLATCGACVRYTKYGLPADRTVTSKKGIAAWTKRCTGKQILPTGGAFKVEVQCALGTPLRLLVRCRTTSGADRLPAVGAKPIFNVQRQAAGGTAAGERLLVLLVDGRLVSLIKAGVTVGTAGRLQRDLAIARPAKKAIGRATLRARHGRRIQGGTTVDTQILATARTFLQADRKPSRARWAFHRAGL